MEQQANDYEKMNLTELAFEMKRVREQLEEAKTHTALLQKTFDLLRKNVIPNKMDELNIENMKVKGVGTLGKRYDAYCNMVPGSQQELFAWLEAEGKGDVIKPSVNSSTLKALMKEMFEAGEEIPEAYVTFTPYTYVSITGKG